MQLLDDEDDRRGSVSTTNRRKGRKVEIENELEVQSSVFTFRRADWLARPRVSAVDFYSTSRSIHFATLQINVTLGSLYSMNPPSTMATSVRIFKAGQLTLSSTTTAPRCHKVSSRIHSPRFSRALSSTPRHHAQMADVNQRSMSKMNTKQMKAHDKENSKLMDASKIKDNVDVGLLPMTFVKPESGQLPSWIKEPSRRFRTEWFYTKCKFRDFVGYDTNVLLSDLSCVQKLTSPVGFGPSYAITQRKIR